MRINDSSIIGTQRLTAHVAAYDNFRTPDNGEPDRIIEVEVWFEADGTPIVDEDRIAACRAKQAYDQLKLDLAENEIEFSEDFEPTHIFAGYDGFFSAMPNGSVVIDVSCPNEEGWVIIALLRKFTIAACRARQAQQAKEKN